MTRVPEQVRRLCEAFLSKVANHRGDVDAGDAFDDTGLAYCASAKWRFPWSEQRVVEPSFINVVGDEDSYVIWHAAPVSNTLFGETGKLGSYEAEFAPAVSSARREEAAKTCGLIIFRIIRTC
jgi:hypothetical protein